MISERPWKTEAALMLAAALMTSLSFLSLAMLLVRERAPEEADQVVSIFEFLVGNWGLYAISMVLIHFFLRHHQVAWSAFLGWGRSGRWKWVAWGALTGLLVLWPAWELKKLAGWAMDHLALLPEEQGAVQVFQEAETWRQYIGFGISAVVLAPVVEEVLFRGIFYTFLKQHTRPGVALWISALLFSAVHGSLVTLLPLLLVGLVLVWIYERTDCLLAPIAAHALFNAVNFAQLIWQAHHAPALP